MDDLPVHAVPPDTAPDTLPHHPRVLPHWTALRRTTLWSHLRVATHWTAPRPVTPLLLRPPRSALAARRLLDTAQWSAGQHCDITFGCCALDRAAPDNSARSPSGGHALDRAKTRQAAAAEHHRHIALAARRLLDTAQWSAGQLCDITLRVLPHWTALRRTTLRGHLRVAAHWTAPRPVTPLLLSTTDTAPLRRVASSTAQWSAGRHCDITLGCCCTGPRCAGRLCEGTFGWLRTGPRQDPPSHCGGPPRPSCTWHR